MKRVFAVFLILALLMATGLPVYAKEIKTVGAVKYEVNADGSLGDPYTGWMKSASYDQRYYYQDGIRLTGLHVMPNGDRCAFDENGVFLGKRSLEDDCLVVFDNDYNVKLSDKKITFRVLPINLPGDPSVNIHGPDDPVSYYNGSPHFSLYIYEDGKWKKIPFVDDDFTLQGYIFDENGMELSNDFSIFDYQFKPGLYRVQTQISNGKRDENGNIINHRVRGEFNMIK